MHWATRCEAPRAWAAQGTRQAWPCLQDTVCVRRHSHARQLRTVRSEVNVAGFHMCAQSSPCCSAKAGTGKPAPPPPPMPPRTVPPALTAGSRPTRPKVRCHPLASLLHFITLAGRPDSAGHQHLGAYRIFVPTECHRQCSGCLHVCDLNACCCRVTIPQQRRECLLASLGRPPLCRLPAICRLCGQVRL